MTGKGDELLTAPVPAEFFEIDLDFLFEKMFFSLCSTIMGAAGSGFRFFIVF
jgi:hypothetical protein